MIASPCTTMGALDQCPYSEVLFITIGPRYFSLVTKIPSALLVQMKGLGFSFAGFGPLGNPFVEFTHTGLNLRCRYFVVRAENHVRPEARTYVTVNKEVS
jgi:hypothetical protein